MLFFVRGDVPRLAFGLTDAQWTALTLLAIALTLLVSLILNTRLRAPIR